MTTCEWFAGCTNEADKDVEHPTMGWVPTCDEHIAWLGDKPSPTMFVPALAGFSRFAALMERIKAEDAEYEDDDYDEEEDA